MNSDMVLARNEVYSSIEMDKPYKSYIKTILGQVAVTVWDNILDKPVDVILRGNPKKKEEDSIVKVWSPKEDSFFQRMNRKHFTKGVIIPYQMPEKVEAVKTIEQATDEELATIINSRFMALNAQLNKIQSVPVLFRMKNLAEEMDKSNKITSAIEKRISEIQAAQYQPAAEESEEDEE